MILFIEIKFLFNQTIIEINKHKIDLNRIKEKKHIMHGYTFYKYYSKINIFLFFKIKFIYIKHKKNSYR